MLDSIWRVSKKDFNVDEFLNNFKLKEISTIFHQGEKKYRGRIYKDSGFNILVSENLSAASNIEEIKKFLKNNHHAFTYLLNNRISSSIDIGCTVGSLDAFTRSIRVDPELLRLLAQYEVSLEFSAYPASDEANQE